MTANPQYANVPGYDQYGYPLVTPSEKVSDIPVPSEKIYTGWMFGADDIAITQTVAVGAQDSLWTDMSLLSADHRQIAIVNSSSADSLSYKVYLSRNGVGAADDKYELTALAGSVVAGAIGQIVLPASIGFDKFIMLETTSVTSTQTYKAYLTGRGG